MTARADILRPAVVLVADRTLSARYSVLFEGILATMQTTHVPGAVMRRLLSPPAPVDAAGRALTAPIGLRRVEASLLADLPLTVDDVAVVTPETIGRVLGPWTRIVAFSSSDPLGRGMSNTTTSRFWDGELYTARWTADLLGRIARSKARYGFRVVAGGAGAWQWALEPARADELGVDTVYEGYFESAGPALFADILAGRESPPHVAAPDPAVDRIRPLRGAATMGVIELSRGCGNGCSYCTMGRTPMRHLPPETILADLDANAAAGVTSAVSSSEDFFRYGGTGGRVNFDALRGLLERIGPAERLRFMQIDHANVSSVLQFSDAGLAEIRRLLTGRERSDYLWVNLGVESANGHLVAAAGRGKLGRIDPDDWADAATDAVSRLSRAGFFPVVSLILGLPGETPADVAATRRLVDDLAPAGAVIFPIFHEPIAPARRIVAERMSPGHLDLYTACYELNFRRVPALFADNQRAGGVGRARRWAFQLLGRGEARLWRRNFRRTRRKLAARPDDAPATLAAEATP